MAITDNNRDLYIRRLQREVSALAAAGAVDSLATTAALPVRASPGSVGTSLLAARADHQHEIPAASSTVYGAVLLGVGGGAATYEAVALAGASTAAAADTALDIGLGTTTGITYDANGRVETVVTGRGVRSFTYDVNGRLTNIVGGGSYRSKSFTYDISGNLTTITVA